MRIHNDTHLSTCVLLPCAALAAAANSIDEVTAALACFLRGEGATGGGGGGAEGVTADCLISSTGRLDVARECADAAAILAPVFANMAASGVWVLFLTPGAVTCRRLDLFRQLLALLCA